MGIQLLVVRYCVCVCVFGCRVIVTRLVSAAGTGYFYTIRKPRIRDKMTLMKYDPVGEWSQGGACDAHNVISVYLYCYSEKTCTLC